MIRNILRVCTSISILLIFLAIFIWVTEDWTYIGFPISLAWITLCTVCISCFWLETEKP